MRCRFWLAAAVAAFAGCRCEKKYKLDKLEAADAVRQLAERVDDVLTIACPPMIEPAPGQSFTCDVAFSEGSIHQAKVEIRGVAGGNYSLFVDWVAPLIGPGTSAMLSEQLMQQQDGIYRVRCPQLDRVQKIPDSRRITCTVVGPKGDETIEVTWDDKNEPQLKLLPPVVP